MQMLVQNCDLLARGEVLGSPQVRKSSATSGDCTGLGSGLVSLSALIETQRRANDEAGRMTRSAANVI
jgi:hypothetical protein